MYVKFTKIQPDVKLPTRQYPSDAGIDIFMPTDGILIPGPNCVPLGLSVDIPNGYLGALYPRSSMTKLGIISQLAPIDSGYKGEIHLLVYNGSGENYNYKKHDRLCQLVLHNIAVVIPVCDDAITRGNNGLGSSGK